MRVFLRPNFEKILNLKSRLSQQSDPIAVGKVEFHTIIGWPVDAMHAERRTQESVARSRVVLGRYTEREQESIDKEMQPTPWP